MTARRFVAALAMALTIAGATTTAQQAPSAAPPPIETDAASHAARRAGSPDQDDWDAAAVAQFFGGGALALGLHEAGHVLTASAMGTNLGLRRVSFGPVPFFAITHDHVGARREYGISSSGFLMQHASSEWLLTRRPALRREHAPIAKGVLAFNVLASAAYGGAALARMGPYERDTRGMATSLRANERWIGALVLAPAVFDTVRYFRPEARWAAWASRGAKAGMVLLAFRAR